MAKIKLTNVLKEGLEEREKKERIREEMHYYAKKMSESLGKLKALAKRDGYDINYVERG